MAIARIVSGDALATDLIGENRRAAFSWQPAWRIDQQAVEKRSERSQDKLLRA